MNDKQIINTLMDIIWDVSDGDGALAVATLINSDIPANIIAEYYGKSETAEYIQKAKDKDLIN